MAKAKAKKPELSSWYKDRNQVLLVQRRVLIGITFVSLVCTLVSVSLIVTMIPLKTISPYVIQVDQKSGITQVVDPVTASQLTGDKAINDYFIYRYIRAREGYRASDISSSYEIVRLMSDPTRVFSNYSSEISGSNPESNPTRLGAIGTRQVKVKSTTKLDEQTIQVRVLIEEKQDGVNITAQYHRIITMKYAYTKIGMSSEERMVNPLGFRVMEYQVDEDVIQ